MRWSTWSEFWAMGGYGLYVWGSFALTALLMALEVWQARRHRCEVLQSLHRERALEAQDQARTLSREPT